jgi:N-methylhydantoinase A
MHGAVSGRLLGCCTVHVPRHSGVFCALGMLNSDLRHDLLRMFLAHLDDLPLARMEDAFAELEARSRLRLEDAGFPDSRVALLRELDLRYLGQQFDIRVGLGAGGLHPEHVRGAFEVEHERRFGHIQLGV